MTPRFTGDVGISREDLRQQAQAAPIKNVAQQTEMAQFQQSAVIALTPIDPMANPSSPGTLPFYQRRLFWVGIGGVAFAVTLLQLRKVST